MNPQVKPKRRLSAVSGMHYIKLIGRSLLFLAATVLYIINRVQNTGDFFSGWERNTLLLSVIWLVFVVEMILRFFPARLESMGCQKQFARNYKKPAAPIDAPKLQSGRVTLLVAGVWLGLNAIIGVLYYTHLIDAGILVLISLLFSVCDMICILFFCPFQTWFMKNKCCTTCRIYNWDFAMMFTPLVFVDNLFARSLLAIALVLLLQWEILVARHPQRFAENTNDCLNCGHCKEKLCYHKTQLQHFLVTNKNRLYLKGNALITGILKKENKKD